MRIAIPTVEDKLSMHFGHCQAFALIDVDEEGKKIIGRETTPAPPHQPGLLPKWLKARGVDMVIAAGMGQRAQSLFAHEGISLMVGAPSDTPDAVVASFLNGTLETGVNACDH